MDRRDFSAVIGQLRATGRAQMRFEGGSMRPLLESGRVYTFEFAERYEVGDMVFCRVDGRYIDAHLVREVDAEKGYLIGNNLGGKPDGWTWEVFGRIVDA